MKPESKLLNAAKSGDTEKLEKVFEQIYYRYCNLVAYIISKYVDNNQDVEELTDDVFVSFSRALRNTEIRSVKYYLVCAAKNAAVNFVQRSSGREIEYLEDIGPQEAAVCDNTPFWELVHALRTVLSEQETQIVVQRVIFNYSFVEIAKILNRPPVTVRTVFNRALKKCKKGAILQ